MSALDSFRLRARALLGIGAMLGAVSGSASAANLVGHWTLNEMGSPYADISGNHNPLSLDTNTTAPVAEPGASGSGAELDWNTSPGVSTRLAAYGQALQNDSFGFSFWVKPVSMSSGDNLIGKEMQVTSADSAFARIAWQVHVVSSSSSTSAGIEFLVRGTNRAKGNFFGSVTSTVTLPLHTASTQWYHVAGCYSASTGKMQIFVNGVETDATNGKAGAQNSDGGAFVVGSMINGNSYVAYAPTAIVDDVQLYDGMLSGQDVQYLIANPGKDRNAILQAPMTAPNATLLAHWKLDETSSPYADSSGNAVTLGLDTGTTPALVTQGVDGSAAQLNWQATPGVATRLCAFGGQMQTDSFGFSLWVHPDNLSPNDNFIGKEMQATGSGASYTKVAWQVHLLGDNGDGTANVEFLLRGSNRTQGNFFGNVISTAKLPLHAASSYWYHLAGGYDKTTGKLQLFVNGVETDSANGIPGASNSDGGAIAIGTMINGSTYVAFAAGADIDDVQIYNGPLTQSNVAFLMANPGLAKAAYVGNTLLGSRVPVAHWKLDESASPYADQSSNAIPLLLGAGTTPAVLDPGIDGGSARLNWQARPGVATRLCAYSAALQNDSFGFSFWVRPINISAGDNLIGKEMQATSTVAAYSRVAWQVHMGQDDGTGEAPIEFLVRGTNRSQGDFFGNVLSSVPLPLNTSVTDWYHVAGGYDATTGKMALYVDDIESDSNNSIPGARNSDGGAVAVGSLINGGTYVAYAAGVDVDDVQIYNNFLSAQDVSFLSTNPGWVTTQTPFRITGMNCANNGDVTLSFNSYQDYVYSVEASTDLSTFTPVSTVTGTSNSTTVTIPKATMDLALNCTVRPRIFGRVRALLQQNDVDENYPPAQILPFANQAAYVPEYHYSLPSAEIGDPNGVVLYQGTYRIFSWDESSSSDLVTWQSQGWPMGAAPPDSQYWTGSVVVDKANTSGFGTATNPPMVAIYTIQNLATGQETIGISYSTDYTHFTPYTGNPILTSNDLLFRDPDVFWDADANCWIMSVARSSAQNIHFYSSTDLKNWKYLGPFGPMGAQQEIWEVPGLVQVPILGNENVKKWVLYVGAGTDKVQYFVGNFDGTTFTPDAACAAYLNNGTGLDGTVFADFEAPTWAALGWTTTGGAFGNGPTVRGTHNQPVAGFLGQYVASSYVNGDWETNSTLTSPSFTISKNCINFLIAGGNHPGLTCINLLVNGNVVRTATGDNTDNLKWAGWNVSNLKGQTAQIQIVDNYGGFWGRIYIDQIMFSDVLNNTGREHANWVDYGSDFYAPKVVRDYDGTSPTVTWLGWIGNWSYEADRPVPSGWGEGEESIFRNIELEATPGGYQIVQTPLPSLEKLRGPVSTAPPCQVQGTMNLTAFQPATNTYELEAVFNAHDSGQNFGMNLCVGGTDKVVLGYDASSCNVYLDRTHSGNVSFSPTFPDVETAPYKSTTGYIKFHVFVDQSSIEVFVNDGERVLTSQIYPAKTSVGIQLFSNGEMTTLRSLQAWPLASIWGAAQQ